MKLKNYFNNVLFLYYFPIKTLTIFLSMAAAISGRIKENSIYQSALRKCFKCGLVLKFFVIILSVSLFVSLAPLTDSVYGADNQAGVPATARHIKTAADLAAIGGVQSKGEYYVLDNDITLTAEWIPIEDFRGTFDGQGHNIRNLYVLESSNRQYAGLFGGIYAAGSIIKNVGITISPNGVTASAAGYEFYGTNAGGLIGYTHGTSYDALTVTNCHVTGSVTAAGSFACAGGLIGQGHRGLTVTNCYAKVDVTAASSGSAYAGGLIGYEGGYAIKNCYAAGDVAAASAFYSCAGGLIGYSTSGTITNCYAAGDAAATDTAAADGSLSANFCSAGGLIGSFLDRGGIVKNCYAAGDVAAASSVAPVCAGGLIGRGGQIAECCYAIGDVTAAGSLSVYAGGLFGRFEGERVTRCYRLSGQKIVGDTLNELGEVLTSKEMQNQQSFVTWDFEAVWAINSKVNSGYPILRGLAANNSNSSGGSSSNGSSSDGSSFLSNPLVLAGIVLIAASAVSVAGYVFYKKRESR
jgi:hypothetical protein